MKPVIVSQEVFNAIRHFEISWSMFEPKHRCYLFMALATGPAHTEEAGIVKRFATDRPDEYMEAVLYGCETEPTLDEEIHEIVVSWYNSPPLENDAADHRELTEKITDFIESKVCKKE